MNKFNYNVIVSSLLFVIGCGVEDDSNNIQSAHEKSISTAKHFSPSKSVLQAKFVAFPSVLKGNSMFTMIMEVKNDTGRKVVIRRCLHNYNLHILDQSGNYAPIQDDIHANFGPSKFDWYRILKPDESVRLEFCNLTQIESSEKDANNRDILLNMLIYKTRLVLGSYKIHYEYKGNGQEVISYNGKGKRLKDCFPDCLCDVTFQTPPVIVSVE